MSVASNSPVTSTNVNTAFMSRTAATTSTVAAVTISNTTQSTDKDTGALIVEGGLGVEKNVNVGGNLTVTGDLTVNGTQTILNTATVESEDNNILLNKGGNDASAEGGGVDVVRTSDNGAFRFDSALTSKWKLGLASAMSEIITAAFDQVLTGIKTFAAAIGMAEVSTPATPSAGYRKLYFKTSGLYMIDSAGTEAKVPEEAYETTVTSGGGKVVTVSSAKLQVLTGSTAMSFQLPVTSTLYLGWSMYILNDSTAAITINSSGADNLCTLPAGSQAEVTCILTSGTTRASWTFRYYKPIVDWATTATAAGTTTLTFTSKRTQIFTGATTQTVVLPATTSTFYNIGMVSDSFRIINTSSGALTVNANNAALVKTILSGEAFDIIVIAVGGTTPTDWFVVASPLANPMTTAGDIIYGGLSGVPTRLAGSAGVLQGQVAGAPSFTQAPTLTTPSMTTPTISTSINLTGGKIAFPATQSASADANTLDDYEEGTWTPTIVGTSAAGVGTYTAQIGTYTKIGQVVHFTFYVLWTAHTGTGNGRVGGFPFTSNSTTNYNWPVNVSFFSNYALTAGNVPMILGNTNATTADINQMPSGGGVMAATTIDVAAHIVASGYYII